MGNPWAAGCPTIRAAVYPPAAEAQPQAPVVDAPPLAEVERQVIPVLATPAPATTARSSARRASAAANGNGCDFGVSYPEIYQVVHDDRARGHTDVYCPFGWSYYEATDDLSRRDKGLLATGFNASLVAAQFITATARYNCHHRAYHLYSNEGYFYGTYLGVGYYDHTGPLRRWHTCRF